MNLDELRPILAAYRKQVEPAWSPATAHEGYDGRAGDPAGQCGVTSAWLQRRLREDHGIEALFCKGDMLPSFGPPLRDHCWLDHGLGWDRLIIDITADQNQGLQSRPVVCARYGDLCGEQIDYLTRERLTEEQVSRDPVQPRLAVLTKALS